MSAAVLRDATRDRLQKRLDEEVENLASRISDSTDQIRVRQGRISGLGEALKFLDQSYQDLHR